MEHLGLALALATLAGFNLYLTTFLVGLGVRLGWFGAPEATGLDALANPAVMGVVLVLFLVEFLVDKIPWADSLWDTIHTFLRPAGAALLALGALDPEAGTMVRTGVTVLAVAAGLLAHMTKAGVRLRLNTSPEPFSNIGASVGEDLIVLAGFWLAALHPAIALWVFIALLVLMGVAAPALWRSSRAILWLIWRKLRMPADPKARGKAKFGKTLSAEDELAISEHFRVGEFKVALAQYCVTGKCRGIDGLGPHLRGMLVAAGDKPGWLYFVRRKGLRGRIASEIDAVGSVAGHESRFLSETVSVTNKSKKLLLNFDLHRGQYAAAEAIAGYLQDHEGTEERVAAAEAITIESEEGETKVEEVVSAADGADEETKPVLGEEPPDVDGEAEMKGGEEVEEPVEEGIGLLLKEGEERNAHESDLEEPGDPEPDASDDEDRPAP